MVNERREIYRVQPDSGSELQVTVEAGAEDVLADEVVDVTIEGAGARLGGAAATLALSAGDQVRLCFRSPQLESTLRIDAEVTGHRQHGEQRHVSFRFLDRENLERVLPEAFYRLFNRRGTYRVADFQADRPVDVELRLSDAADDDVASAIAQLKNLSTMGAGLLAEPEAETTLGDAESVHLSLQLPGEDNVLGLSAWIRNREVRADSVYYGVLFDARHTEAFLEQHEAIVDYVLCRYQEKLIGS
jgi:hypothetical protein